MLDLLEGIFQSIPLSYIFGTSFIRYTDICDVVFLVLTFNHPPHLFLDQYSFH
jgi:hypothetical protein